MRKNEQNSIIVVSIFVVLLPSKSETHNKTNTIKNKTKYEENITTDDVHGAGSADDKCTKHLDWF